MYRPIDGQMLITHYTKQKTTNCELGGGLGSGDGTDFVVWERGAGGAGPDEKWQNTVRSTARSSKLAGNL